MTELLNAKAEIIAELDTLNAVNLADQTDAKVAAKQAELDAELETFKTETEQSALAEHNAAIAELEVGLKYIERAIARAETAESIAEAEAMEEVEDQPIPDVDATQLAEA